MLSKIAKWLFPAPAPAPVLLPNDMVVCATQNQDGVITIVGFSATVRKQKVRFAATKKPDEKVWALVSRESDGVRWFQENYPGSTFSFNGSYHEMTLPPADEVMIMFQYDVKYMRSQ